VVAGVSKISPLKRTTEVVKNRDGGDPSVTRKSPGRTDFDAITLERGVTHDPEFDRWANKVLLVNGGRGAEVSLRDFRKDIVIQLLNEAGQVAKAYKVYRAWPSEYQIVGELDANANAVAIQSLKLESEGWELDPDVPEPEEPSFTLPA
jgi:phage tail-like protein